MLLVLNSFIKNRLLSIYLSIVPNINFEHTVYISLTWRTHLDPKSRSLLNVQKLFHIGSSDGCDQRAGKTSISAVTWVVRRTHLSMLIATRLSIEAVQHMTSNATHVSHSASPSCHSALFTCVRTPHTIITISAHQHLRFIGQTLPKLMASIQKENPEYMQCVHFKT